MRTEFNEIFNQEKKYIEAYRQNKTFKDIEKNQEKSEPENLVGLAISGGGIRSATFGLGVLEALKKRGLLDKIDYLSTVSGGGYIGAWLSANCHRNNNWLDKEDKKNEGFQWRDSIVHLRRYSNYLSPKMGLLSADTWSMATVWLRNTLLIQIMIFLAIASMLLGAKVLSGFFVGASSTEFTILGSLLPFIISLFWMSYCLIGLHNNSNFFPEWAVGQGAIWKILFLLMVGTFFGSMHLWSHVHDFIDAGKVIGFKDSIFRTISIFYLLFFLIYISLLAFTFFSITAGNKVSKAFKALFIAIIPTIASIILVTTILFIVAGWKVDMAKCDNFVKFLAFAFIPPALLGTLSFGIVLQIGMIGRASSDYTREWWSRFGAWLAIAGFAWMVVVFVILLGPWTIEKFNASDPSETWHFMVVNATWVVTTVAGIFAGKSVDTNGGTKRSKSAKLKEIIATIAPIVFILGLLALISVVLHLLVGFYSDVQKYTLESLIMAGDINSVMYAFVLSALIVLIFSWRIDINEFSLNAFYRHRLTRCFIGASRKTKERNPHPFTGFDAQDDIKLGDLISRDRVPQGPFHIVNCALNLGGSSDLSLHTRNSSNFSLSPLNCGSSYPVKDRNGTKKGSIGYMETKKYGGEMSQPSLGQAIAVSGAAASPNSGYHTSAPIAFLLTLFNARLGWWFPNPNKSKCDEPSPRFSLKYMLLELFGCANERSEFLAISDGGHFENLAAYELIKRKCKVVIISDGECDPELQLEGLATLIRMCRVDDLAEIDIDTRAIQPTKDGWSSRRWAVGRIDYRNNDIEGPETGYLIYLKASMNGHENVSVQQYKAIHPDFPHETTSDQFYAEDQFECYRILGKEITSDLFDKIENIEDILQIAEELYRINAPQIVDQAKFIQHANRLTEIWRQLGVDKNLESLAKELCVSDVSNNAVFYMWV